MLEAGFSIRPVRQSDDPLIASVIRTVMPEFGATGSGFAINDPEVDWMSRAYAAPQSAYFVVERGGKVMGGGGVAPLVGGDGNTCELRKMYFLPEARGIGAGTTMMEHCLQAARHLGFNRCYLETLCGMDAACACMNAVGSSALRSPWARPGMAAATPSTCWNCRSFTCGNCGFVGAPSWRDALWLKHRGWKPLPPGGTWRKMRAH